MFRTQQCAARPTYSAAGSCAQNVSAGKRCRTRVPACGIIVSDSPKARYWTSNTFLRYTVCGAQINGGAPTVMGYPPNEGPEGGTSASIHEASLNTVCSQPAAGVTVTFQELSDVTRGAGTTLVSQPVVSYGGAQSIIGVITVSRLASSKLKW